MTKGLKWLVSAALGAALATSGAAAAPAPVKIQTGLVQGVEARGVVVYKGIPYAAPPVGKLRWRAPQAPARWSGVRASDKFGDSCMQNPANVGGPLTVSEDCLYLNVWTPPHPAGAMLPVMVWIHGGGFNLGSSAWAQTDGTSLAKHGVVLVSLNYRLGKFGFFAHPALTREARGGELGNYGVMDMIAALKWVKANISRFGGDPANVTVFGESAGGGAVNFLMASKDARGLFEKAIVESGGGRSVMQDLRAAEAEGEAAAKGWGVASDDAAALRALPASTVLGNATMTSGGGRPFIDGQVIAEPTLQAFRAGHIAHVPYMIGTNAFESGAFPGMADQDYARYKADWPRIAAVYDGYGSHDEALVKQQFATDVMMTEPARALARAAAAHGLPTYLYQFAYLRPSQRGGKLPGPIHFDEVYVVFDTMMTSPSPKSDDKAAVEAMESRWTGFARTGRPSADWPRFRQGDEALMEFTDAGPKARKDWAKARLDLTTSLLDAPPPKPASARLGGQGRRPNTRPGAPAASK
jgi:para-nitrobenzyl esterase